MAADSLERLLLRRLLTFLLPLAALAMAAAYYGTQHFAGLAFDHVLARRAYALADQVVVVNGRVEVSLPRAAREILEFDPTDVLYYRLVGPDGTTLVQNADLPMVALSHATNRPRLAYRTLTFSGEPIRVAVYMLPLSGTHAQGAVTVMAGETLDKRTRLAREALGVMAVPFAVLILLIPAGVSAVLRRGLGPVEALRRSIGLRRPDDLTPIEDTGMPREMKPLLDEMNRLLADVAQLQQMNRIFLADAAHQLRTPLAGFGARLQLMSEISPAHREALDNDLARLSRLVNQLLALSRADSLGQTVARREVDLMRLAQSLVADMAPRFLAAGMEIGFEGEPMQLRVDADALTEALGNLLDNVLRHSGAANVVVTVRREGDGAVLAVTDDGAGVPEDERDGLLGRFVRGRGAAALGSGLGLAIVDEIVHAHGGSVRVEAGQGGKGLAVTLTLPGVSLPLPEAGSAAAG